MANHKIAVDKNSYDKRDWIRLVNSLSGFKSANLLGTVNAAGNTNLSMISSCFHLGANPPLLGFILRPHSPSSPRHSLLNINETGFFTLNHINETMYKQAHQTSARYPYEVSEFTEVGLTEETIGGFTAPFVKESLVQLGLKCVEVLNIEANNTTLVIGEIQKIHIPKESLKEDGFIDLEACGSLCVSGLDSYHTTSRLSRLSYAKTDRPTKELTIDGIELT